MTIELQTGLPGAGKTLYTLDRVQKLHKQSGRPVFYSGILINKAKLPDWQEIEADKWYTAPPEAIVIIDECQRLFRPRPSGSAVPKYESELETHRHGGIDLVLLTQSPRLVSIAVRELVGIHRHSVRQFGLQRATIHQWPECKLNIQSRADSIKTQYSYNRAVYGWYKSAEAHTVKASIPLKVWLLIALVVFLPVIAGVIYWRLSHHDTAVNVQSVGAMVKGERASLNGGEYVAQFKPRVAGLAYTAPAYDKVTQAVRAPYPAACLYTKDRCQCYSQQATKLDVPDDMCRGIASGGFFVAWDDKHVDQQAGLPHAQSLNPVDVQPLQGSGLAGFNTSSRLASADPVSVVNPPAQDQSGRGRAIAR